MSGGPVVGPVVVLDSEGLAALARGDGQPASELVAAAVKSAHNNDRDVVVPAVVLAEAYRSPARIAAANAALHRSAPIKVRDTDQSLAKFVGGVLAAASAGSEDMVDAHCVAVAVESGGRGVVITSDEHDMTRLAAPHPNIAVRSL